jgi:hypothetical protein
MRLLDVIRDLGHFNHEDVIFAHVPWHRDSTAMVLNDQDGEGLPEEAAQLGLEYFLEISITREFLEAWTNGFECSLEEQCDRIIYYATYDA